MMQSKGTINDLAMKMKTTMRRKNKKSQKTMTSTFTKLQLKKRREGTTHLSLQEKGFR